MHWPRLSRGDSQCAAPSKKKSYPQDPVGSAVVCHTKTILMTDLRLDSELPLNYFSLQLEYAKRVAQILRISLGQALMEFTSFWRRIHDLRLLKINKTEWSF